MFMLPVELMNVSRSFAESQLAGCTALAQAALDSGATLLDLNVSAARDQLAAAGSASSQLLFVRDPQDLLHVAAQQGQLAFDRAQRYGRQVAGVASDAHQRFDRVGRDITGPNAHNPIE